jgi:hypothetical protein
MESNPAAPVPGHRSSAMGVVEPDDPALVDLRYEILSRTRTALADVDHLDCIVERNGPRIMVRLGGPAISTARQRALAVRVLDAVRAVGRTYGQVDVTYEATPDDRES